MSSRRQALARILTVALALLVPVHTALLVWNAGVDIPYMESWELTRVIARALDGELRLADLWVQANEHRPVIPRLVMVALAVADGWNARVEMFGSLVCAGVTWGALATAAAATGRAVRAPAGLAVVALSAVLFSFSQWQNWLWGWQLHLLMSQTTAVLALVLLARPSRGAFAGAVGVGAVATFCAAAGAGVWPAGALLLLVRDPPGEGLRRRLLLWALGAAVSLAAYTVGYVAPYGVHLAGPGDAVPVAAYLLCFLGAPQAMSVGAGPLAAVSIGASGLLLVLAGAARARRAGPELRPLLALWCGLAVWGVGAGGLCAVGRAVEFGRWQALDSSRYLAFSTVFSAAVVGLLVSWTGPREPARRRAAAVAGIALLGLVAALGSWRHQENAVRWRRTYTKAADMAAEGHREALHVLMYYQDPMETAELMAILRSRRLSYYRGR